ncbi:N-acetyllactosaminide 3-alpha-galactosyltransferase [Oesophagostomum dentatum]|uniref:N-acetyllactosaminide 3-alpha-galactosyltransferase n=1 Tax=Oesophagostomum dentatum TaxID=61180 RepID=A0A0B1SAP7_OESDE|nr:N-acetyllactosaminide 3-alpha-galactosyltransferase [Oesophagostomum dentatum]
MHPFLTDQFLDYSIIVVEQASNQTFNRGKLLNVGFVEAMKLYEWDCFLLHDVDLLPEDRRNLHVCKRYDYTMSLDIDWPPCEQHPISDNDRLAYNGMFGTSSMLSTAQFRKVNGLSNRFWGWGGEDDDLYTRVVAAGYKVERYNTSVARYKMIKHAHEPKSNPINPCRYKLLNLTKRDWKNDGLNSLRYRLLNITFTTLYTHMLVDLLESEEKPKIDKQLCP